MTRLLRLYPGWWRARYGDEVGAILGSAPSRRADQADLVRGALDAWLHPPVPSRIPAVAALVGGGLWTAISAGIVAQPVPPDWPGYVAEVLGAALVAVGFLLVALVGIAIRGFDTARRSIGLLIWLSVIAYVGWMLSIVGSMSGAVEAPTLAATQTLAMVTTVAVGLTLIRIGDVGIGFLVLLAGVTLLIPWAGAWLAFGAVWTAIGLVLAIERPRRLRIDRRFA